MIHLHERFSEYSYGYGATREAQDLLKRIGLTPTPFLPSLIHEASLGFDVAFNEPGHVLLLQFKLGDQLSRFRRTKLCGKTPQLSRPFWRFTVDTSHHQFVNLYDLETLGAETYYVAPRFADWGQYEQAFCSKTVLDSSLLIRPSEIHSAVAGSHAGAHRVVYDQTRCYVCSEPSEAQIYNATAVAEQLANTIRRDQTPLAVRIEALVRRAEAAERPRNRQSALLDHIRDRFEDPTTRMAVEVGFNAWIAGGQLLFVTPGDHSSTEMR